MLIKQIFIENGKEASDIRVSNGVFEAIAPALEDVYKRQGWGGGAQNHRK